MILEQLMEKKDLLIYIDVRMAHLTKLVSDTGVVFSMINRKALSKNKRKAMERNKRRWLSQIHELKILKRLISEGKLKKRSKVYWKQQNQKI